MPGAHDTGITQVTGATSKQAIFTGWTATGLDASDDITVTQETSVVSSSHSTSAAKIVVADATGYPRLHYGFSSTGATLPFYAACIGNKLVFSADVKLASGVANACTLFIEDDGGVSYSAAKANDTNWERLIVSRTIAASTFVIMGFQFEAAATVYLDNCRAKAIATGETVTSLPYKWRPPITLYDKGSFTTSPIIDWSAGSATTQETGDGSTDFSTDYNINTNRPAWANRIGVKLTANTAAGYFYGYPYGITAYFGAMAITNGSAPTASFGTIPIGKNGQVEFFRTGSTMDCYVYGSGWIGEV